MNTKSRSSYIENYLVSLLADIDKKFKINKKSVSPIEKQIVQLLISQIVNSSQLHDDCLFFHLPYTGEIAWIDLRWPIDLDPNIKNQIKRKFNKIEEKLKKPRDYNWDYELNKDFKLFTALEVFRLNSLGLIKESTWKKVEDNLFLLYRKDKEYKVTKEQFLFKMYYLLKYRDNNKNKTQGQVLEENPVNLLRYKASLKLFNKNEKKEFRRKTFERHYFQPGLIKVRGTSLETILNDSILCAHKTSTVFYEEESQRQGYDIEVFTRSNKLIRISSKTGNFSKFGVVHISSSRTQKLETLEDKINKVNDELDKISIITACISIVDGNRKKYIRLALDPIKIKACLKDKNWKTQKEANKNKSQGWQKYTYNNGKFSLTITEGKSHQVDFYIPLSFFYKIDEFYID